MNKLTSGVGGLVGAAVVGACVGLGLTVGEPVVGGLVGWAQTKLISVRDKVH